MIDGDGLEWAPLSEVAARYRISRRTLYRWAKREHRPVRWFPTDTEILVCVPDVQDEELEWHRRKGGRRRSGVSSLTKREGAKTLGYQ